MSGATGGYVFQCCTCGALHSLTTVEVSAAGGPEVLAGHGRECPDCALHGRPHFPLWRWRRVAPPTAAERLALRGLLVRLRAQYGPPD